MTTEHTTARPVAGRLPTAAARKATQRALVAIQEFTAKRFPNPEPIMLSTADPKVIRKQLNAEALQKGKRKLADPPPPLDFSSPANGTLRPESVEIKANSNGHKKSSETPEQLGPIVPFALGDLCRHPDNRVPTKEEIEARAQSMQGGQLEPIVVWQPPLILDPAERYQILSGETRVLAARKLGWKTIQGRLMQGLDAAGALSLLARYNGERKDLDAIQKARLGKRLMEPLADGGGGKTRDGAAKEVGLSSGPALSNLIGLLELPEVWQQRVAAGELAPSWAEKLRRVAHVVPVMAKLEEDWREKEKGDFSDTFLSRSYLEDAIHWAIQYELGAVPSTLLDKLVPEVRDSLGIVAIALPGEGRGKQSEQLYATNKELLAKLTANKNAEATVEQAREAAGDEPLQEEPRKKAAAAAKEPTPAELKAKAKEAAEKLEMNIRAWRHQWLCELIAARFEDQDWVCTKFLVWLLTQFGRTGFDVPVRLREILKSSAREWCPKLTSFSPPTMRQHVGYQRSFDLDEALRDLCRAILSEPDNDPRYSRVPHDIADELARDYRIDLAQEWKLLQSRRGPGNPAAQARFEAFFELHQAAQLDKLAAELDVYVGQAANKLAKVKFLTGRTQPLPLPSSIAPVQAATTKGTKATKKAKAKKGK